MDFGVARAADATSVTRSGAAVGTVAYMAPEQVLGGSSSGSADVFALGQTAVFAATGGTAYGEGDPHAVLYRVVHEEPDLSRVPAPLRELIAGCLSRAPEDRPTVREVIDSIRVIREAQPGGAGPVTDAWLPGEVAEGIAARAEGARVTGAEPTGRATPPPRVAGGQESGGGQQVQVSPASGGSGVVGAETAAVGAEPVRKRGRGWLLAAVGVALVACGAGATLWLVPSGGSGDARAAGPAATGRSEVTRSASASPVRSTYAGIVMTDRHDLGLSDDPLRPRADDGQSNEDLTYAVYRDGAVLAPGSASGGSGDVGLLTLRGKTEGKDVTLDAEVWRGGR
ncbi:serine/threonine protein kinase [Streptomyces sp. WG-D5]